MSGERIQELPRLGFLGGFLDRFLFTRVHGHRGGFPSRDVHPPAFRTDRGLDLDRLVDNVLPLSHGFHLFVLYVLTFVGRDGESGGLGGHMGGKFE